MDDFLSGQSKIKFEVFGLPLPNTNRVGQNGNDCKLILRLFSIYFYMGRCLGDGVFFTQRIGLNARIIIGEVLACEGGGNWVVRMTNGNGQRTVGKS